MRIEIFGMGCPKCKKLYENTQAALKEANVRVEVIKVEDMQKIMDSGIIATPAIAIDGEVKAAGRIPAPEEIKRWFGAE